jgi:hypothetical protein
MKHWNSGMGAMIDIHFYNYSILAFTHSRIMQDWKKMYKRFYYAKTHRID